MQLSTAVETNLLQVGSSLFVAFGGGGSQEYLRLVATPDYAGASLIHSRQFYRGLGISFAYGFPEPCGSGFGVAGAGGAAHFVSSGNGLGRSGVAGGAAAAVRAGCFRLGW